MSRQALHPVQQVANPSTTIAHADRKASSTNTGIPTTTNTATATAGAGTGTGIGIGIGIGKGVGGTNTNAAIATTTTATTATSGGFNEPVKRAKTSTHHDAGNTNTTGSEDLRCDEALPEHLLHTVHAAFAPQLNTTTLERVVRQLHDTEDELWAVRGAKKIDETNLHMMREVLEQAYRENERLMPLKETVAQLRQQVTVAQNERFQQMLNDKLSAVEKHEQLQIPEFSQTSSIVEPRIDDSLTMAVQRMESRTFSFGESMLSSEYHLPQLVRKLEQEQLAMCQAFNQERMQMQETITDLRRRLEDSQNEMLRMSKRHIAALTAAYKQDEIQRNDIKEHYTKMLNEKDRRIAFGIEHSSTKIRNLEDRVAELQNALLRVTAASEQRTSS